MSRNDNQQEANPSEGEANQSEAAQVEETQTEAKAKEPEPRNWTKSQYTGRKVFLSRGTGILQSEDTAAERYLVLVGDTEIDVPMGSVRFKAVDDRFREKYNVDKSVRTAKGAPSVNCGDDISAAMLGLIDLELKSIAKENGLEENWERWQSLNPGMRRMNLGNILRNRHKKYLANPKENPAVVIFGHNPATAAANRTAQLADERKKNERVAAEKKAAKAQAAKDKKAKAKEKKVA